MLLRGIRGHYQRKRPKRTSSRHSDLRLRLAYRVTFSAYIITFEYGGSCVIRSTLNASGKRKIVSRRPLTHFSWISSRSYPDFEKTKSAAVAIFRVIDIQSLINPNPETGFVLNVKGEVYLEGNQFCYSNSTHPDVVVLEKIDSFVSHR
jgi:hypothetical protein